jgi:hypothetical protein
MMDEKDFGYGSMPIRERGLFTCVSHTVPSQ